MEVLGNSEAERAKKEGRGNESPRPSRSYGGDALLADPLDLLGYLTPNSTQRLLHSV